ncbi:WXG100 family type VII secretion target [Streptomyces thermoalcalitolerans]|uniref:ESAT-6-like protein n=1 Tax=Streptomyces thermoalcalitolerans TaxID=65605 RepID=A0ABP4A0L2_9ACTN
MASNFDGLNVSYSGVASLASQLSNEAKILEQDLQELKQMVMQSRQYWEGSAQGTFDKKLAEWRKEAGDIHAALAAISKVVHEAGGTYKEGDLQAARHFL